VAQGKARTCNDAERRPAVDQIGSEVWTGTLLPPRPSVPTPAMNLPYLMQSSDLPFLMCAFSRCKHSKCSHNSQGACCQASIQSIILLPSTHLTGNLSSEAQRRDGDQNVEVGTESRERRRWAGRATQRRGNDREGG
jgi:hypothetical protein